MMEFLKDFKEAVLIHLQMREVDGLKRILNQSQAANIISLFQELSLSHMAITYRLLTTPLAYEVYNTLPYEDQHILIKALAHKETTQLWNELCTDDRDRFFDELPAPVAKKVFIFKEENNDEPITISPAIPQTNHISLEKQEGIIALHSFTSARKLRLLLMIFIFISGIVLGHFI